jgi:arsenite methyltransferase
MLDLQEVVNIRYAKESSCCTPLSCGSALGLVELQVGEVFLDLGSGRGTDVLKGARIVGNSGKAIGVDFTQEMIEISQINQRKMRVSNAEFFQSSIESLPFPDEYADAIISNCTINHSPSKEKVYSEIYRVLKANGRSVISDIISETHLPEEITKDPQAWAKCYGGAIPQKEYFHAISKAGFRSVEILEESVPYEKGGVLVRSITIRLFKKGVENETT